MTLADRITLRAKVWAAGSVEPLIWQAEVDDLSPTRSTGGAVGLRTFGPGNKYFDDLLVTPLGSVVANFTAFPQNGASPLPVVFFNNSNGASSYLWDFGDSLTSTQNSPAHTYAAAGVYTVTLTASNGADNDTLVRPHYITVTPSLTRTWQLITPTLSPPVVGEHALAYDSARSRVVLYGGNGAGWPYESSTWEFDGTNWITITTATSPTARYGAAMAYDAVRGVTLLFGGSNADDLALNQTWQYTNATWSLVAIGGSMPLSRTYASLVAGPNGQLYLFGGNDGETYFDDLWRYENGTWAEIAVSSPRPPARTLAATTFQPSNLPTPNRLLVFGGRSVTGTVLSDFWAFDLGTTTWTQINASGGPPGRMAHTLTYDAATGNIVLVGGTTNEGDTLLGDTWHYQMQSGWTQATPTTPLSPRAYHGAVYGSNAIILFENKETWRYE